MLTRLGLLAGVIIGVFAIMHFLDQPYVDHVAPADLIVGCCGVFLICWSSGWLLFKRYL